MAVRWTTGRWQRMKALMRARAGATAVEFALVAPIFIIMTMGVFEIGRAFWIRSSMQFAVEETTRYAIVNTSATTATLATYAQTTLTASGVNAADITFTATTEVSGSRTFISVTGTYNFSVVVPIVPIPDITLSVKSRVPIS